VQLARQQFDRGQFADVVRTIEEAIALDPSCADAYTLLAKSNLELAKPATAEQAVLAAWQAGLDTPDLHYLAGVILEQRDQLEPALSQYEKAREMNDANADYFIAQVECLVALGRAAEALKLVDENADRFDDQASVAILGARIAAMLGDTDDAIRRYQHPSVVLTDSPLAAQELGLLLAHAGRCTEAVRTLRPMVDDSVNSTADTGAIRRGLAACYLTLDEPALARAVLADYAREHSDDVASQVLLARSAIAAGDFLTALRAIDLARQRAPNDHDIGLLLATTLWRRGDARSAESVLIDLLADDPYDVDAWCLLGEVLQSTDRAEEAREVFERALAIEPDSRWAAQAKRSAERLAPPPPSVETSPAPQKLSKPQIAPASR
jgi:Tfp pilus assembly protein PilF